MAPNHIVAFDGQIELEALRLFGLPGQAGTAESLTVAVSLTVLIASRVM